MLEVAAERGEAGEVRAVSNAGLHLAVEIRGTKAIETRGQVIPAQEEYGTLVEGDVWFHRQIILVIVEAGGLHYASEVPNRA